MTSKRLWPPPSFGAPQRGIFKPRRMPFLLSIRTVYPRKGARVWYDDQRRVHQQIFAGQEELDYAFMGTDPAAPENVWLREAAERQVPLIYFLGVAPGPYQAIIPTFVVEWDARALRARVAFGELAGPTATATAPDAVERRYALRLVKQRLHQASFREGVLAAYDHRCAISNLPDDDLLDAAHIMADADELFGQPVLVNGLAPSKIHHAAFDNHLIGIDPDGQVHVSERLPMLHDGPLLEQSRKGIAGSRIRPPRRREDHPDRDRRPVRAVHARCVEGLGGSRLGRHAARAAGSGPDRPDRSTRTPAEVRRHCSGTPSSREPAHNVSNHLLGIYG